MSALSVWIWIIGGLGFSEPAHGRDDIGIHVVHLATRHDALFDIHLVGQRGWAVGDHGLLLTTRDEGRSWQVVSSPTDLSLLGLDMRPSGRAVAVGQGGVILYNEDVEGPWREAEADLQTRLFSVSLDSDGFGLAVGERGAVLRTLDHGRSWQTLMPDWHRLLGRPESPHLYDVLVEHEQAAIVVGEFGLIMHTVNGGASWSVQHQGDQSLFALQRTSQKEYWAVGQDGFLVRSRDVGKTWETREVGHGVELLDVRIALDGCGILLGRTSFFLTRDGGESWFSAPATPRLQTAWYQAIEMKTDGDYLIAGASGSILHVSKCWGPPTKQTHLG